MNKETFLNFRPKENFVDFKKSFEDIKESSEKMLKKVNEYNPVKVSNVQGTIDDEKMYIENNLNKVRDKLVFNTNLDKIPDVLKSKSKAIKRKKEASIFDFSWRLYRTISLLIILVSFFVLKAIYDKFVSGGATPYILKIYNIVAVLIIINLCVFLFYITYYRYISTLKGQKGRKGGRGVKGIPGENTMCDISKKKIATLYREKNRKPKKDIIDTSSNVVIDLNTKIYETGWWNIAKNDDNGNFKLVKPENGNIGIFCDSGNCDSKNFTNVGEELAEYINFFKSDKDENDKKIKLKENKPIIGASINFNKINKNIQAVMFYSDKNKGHNPEKYKYSIFGEEKSKVKLDSTNKSKNKYIGKDSLKDISKNSAKQDFRCPPNSAIYKIEGVHDNNGLKGLKFYCQDIYTGKSRKAYNPQNKKVYGVSFGIEPFPETEEYYYDKIECPFTKTTIKNSNNIDIDTMKPSFVSHIGGSFDTSKNKIYNINVEGCSYYKK